MAEKYKTTKERTQQRRKGNPNLGRAQKKCKGKTGEEHKKCIRRESKNKK